MDNQGIIIGMLLLMTCLLLFGFAYLAGQNAEINAKIDLMIESNE